MSMRDDLERDEFAVLRRMFTIGGSALLFVFVLFGSCYTVDQGERVVVTRFGAVKAVSEPGVHFKAPLIDSLHSVNVQTSWIEWKEWREEGEKENRDSRMESYSKDQQPAHIGVKITYKIKPDSGSVTEIFSQYKNQAGFEQNVLVPRAYEAVKVTFGRFTAIEAVQHRDRFISEVRSLYTGIVGNGPVTIEGFQIQDIKFSPGYEHAIEERMKAEVEVTKVLQNLEKEKLTAQMVVVKAEADAKSTKLRGEAEAAAIRARSDALRDSPKLVELTAAEKWNGVLPTTIVPGSALPFVNIK